MKKRIRKKEKQLALRDQLQLYKKRNKELDTIIVSMDATIKKHKQLAQEAEHTLLNANCELQSDILNKNKQIAQLKEDNKKLQARLQAKHKSTPMPTSSIQRITDKIKEFVSGKN